MVFGTQEAYVYTVKYLDPKTGDFNQWHVPCLREVYGLHSVFDGLTFNKLLYRCYEPDGTRQLSDARDKVPNLHISRRLLSDDAVIVSVADATPDEPQPPQDLDQVDIISATPEMLAALGAKDCDAMRAAASDP